MRRFLTVAVAALSLSAVGVATADNGSTMSNEAQQKAMERLQQKIDARKATTQSGEPSIDDLKKRIKELEDQLAQVEIALSKANEQIAKGATAPPVQATTKGSNTKGAKIPPKDAPPNETPKVDASSDPQHAIKLAMSNEEATKIRQASSLSIEEVLLSKSVSGMAIVETVKWVSSGKVLCRIIYVAGRIDRIYYPD